jgi:hypothetical protein
MMNPYDGHPALSPLESEVLWEYAKLAQHLNLVCISCIFSYYTQFPIAHTKDSFFKSTA